MQFKNHKITEALCAFRFESTIDNIGISLFGEYFNKIKSDGFIHQKDFEPLKFSFQINPSDRSSQNKIEEDNLTMLFTNSEKNFSILIRQNYISFHALKNSYSGWDNFFNNYVKVYLEKYLELESNVSIKNTQMLYLNNFEIDINENLSDYLNCVPNSQNFGESSEFYLLSQSNYKIKPNLDVILKTGLKIEDSTSLKKITLECNCISHKNNVNDDWVKLINQSHDKAYDVFVKVTNDKFKEFIK
ncbi:MAG: TIGR04255 family protein [Cyanobacteriota bacterium]